MDRILKYFPDLTQVQKERLDALYDLYLEWNARINVISRKDTDQIYLHHVLHSLAVAKVCRFDAKAKIMDVGCGGGFPGIPLAILFPETDFTLVDSIGKKITVVRAVADALGLENVTALNARAEKVEGRYDYVVSRAVTSMASFVGWIWPKIRKGQAGELPNGILYLKGGDLVDELSEAGKKYGIYEISDFFPDDFFETKKVVYIPR